jgi:hypothetical protein
VTAATPKVFISYRRGETAGHAGRLYDALAARFGEGNVFMDVEQAPGIDFVDRIGEAVGGCDALLVVMGPGWAGRRLAEPGDLVRVEVEAALRRPDVTVIPVLVAGAQMPAPDALPESVRALSRRNAQELSDLRWRYDVGRIVDALAERLEGSAPEPGRGRRRVLAGAVAAVVLLGAVGAVLAVAGVFSGGGDPGQTAAAGSGAARPEPSSPTTDDALRLVDDYARRYEARDAAGLGRLMSPGVVLKDGATAERRGRDRVVAALRGELAKTGTRQLAFDWDDEHADATEDALEVIGPYAITAGGAAQETGNFGVRLKIIGSALLIDELCFDCPDLERPGRLLQAP